jgi:hypothetical protein
MPDIIPIPMRIRVDSGIVEAHTHDEGPTAEVVFRCPFTQRYDLVNSLLGPVFGDLLSGAIYRYPPCRYPPSPNLMAWDVTKIHNYGKPARDFQGFLSFQWSDVTCVFKQFPFTTEGQEAWTTVSIQNAGEKVSLPEYSYVFANDNRPIPTQLPVNVFNRQITIKRHRMPFIPFSQLNTLEGCVNKFDFPILGVYYPTGTLLFTGSNSTLEIATAGRVTYSVEYHLMYRPVDWNKFIHPRRGYGWQFVNIDTEPGGIGGGHTGTMDTRLLPYVDFRMIP